MSNISPSFIQERRQSVGAQLKHLRLRSNMTVAEIADMIGVTSLTVWKVEEGKYSCDLDLLNSYLTVLDAQLIIER